MLCVCMRNGVEVWIEKDRADFLQDALERITQSKFIRFDDQTFNSADVVGIFHASTMADATRRKNGMWGCQHGNWHDKGEKCGCISKEHAQKIKQREEAIKACGKCQNGFIFAGQNAVLCECQKPFQGTD